MINDSNNTPAETHMITDFAGNTFPASRLEENESPGFDVRGARRDQALQSFGNMCSSERASVAEKGDAIRLFKAPGKHKHLIGKIGVVIWTCPDQWARRSYNRKSFSAGLMDGMLASMGKYTRMGVQFAGGETVWMSAHNPLADYPASNRRQNYEVTFRPTNH